MNADYRRAQICAHFTSRMGPFTMDIMKDAYRFTKRKGRSIQVMFVVDPGHWHSTGTDKMKDAYHFAETWLEEFGKSGNRKACPTFGDFARNFFSNTGKGSYREYLACRGQVLSESSLRLNGFITERYLIPAFNNKRIDRITDTDIEDAIMRMTLLSTGKPASNAYKNKALNAIRTILKFAKRCNLVDKNEAYSVSSFEDIAKPREPMDDNYLAKLFPKDDSALMWNFRSLMWATYFCVMKDTGFRPAEVSGLSIDDWYPELHGFVCTKSVIDGKVKHSIKTTNHGMGTKIGIVSDQTERLISELIRNLQDDGMLFHTGKGNLVITRVAQMVLYSVEDRIGLPRKTQYTLRHAFDTKAMKRLPMETVNLLMGHTVYERTYDHRSGEELLRQVNEVRDKMFS